MRGARFFAAAFAASIALLGTAGTGAAATSGTIDLSSLAAIDSYLASKGYDPSTFVHQVGMQNYAGPASGCPGIGWNCTTAARVVQLAFPGGQNVSDCDSGPAVVVQSQAAWNDYSCSQSESESVDVTQSGDSNRLRVKQIIDERSSNPDTTQTAIEQVGVSQTGTKRNDVDVLQIVRQTIGTSAEKDPANQVANQEATITQHVSGAGSNFSKIHQGQDQNISGTGTGSQSQNVTSQLPDCAPETVTPTAPNACVEVDQTTDHGTNNSRLLQKINQQGTTSGVATQQQGMPYSPDTAGGDGIKGHVHQTVNYVDGKSLDHASAQERQQLFSGGGSQQQFDPIGCCGASQQGGTNDNEIVDEQGFDSAKGAPMPMQVLQLFGEIHTQGSCSATQHARTNGDATNTSANSPCPALIENTSCTSAPDSCTTIQTPPCADEYCIVPDSGPPLVLTFFSTSPTYGASMPALDVTSEPDWYTASW
jgi:hypothetical protein